MIQSKLVTFEDEGNHLIINSIEDTAKQTKKLVFQIRPVTPKQGHKPSESVDLNLEDMKELLNWLSKDVLADNVPGLRLEVEKAPGGSTGGAKGQDNGMTSTQQREARARMMGMEDMSHKLGKGHKVKIGVEKPQEKK